MKAIQTGSVLLLVVVLSTAAPLKAKADTTFTVNLVNLDGIQLAKDVDARINTKIVNLEVFDATGAQNDSLFGPAAVSTAKTVKIVIHDPGVTVPASTLEEVHVPVEATRVVKAIRLRFTDASPPAPNDPNGVLLRTADLDRLLNEDLKQPLKVPMPADTLTPPCISPCPTWCECYPAPVTCRTRHFFGRR